MRQCVVKNIEGGAAKWIDVAPARFPGWIDDFARRHGDCAPGHGYAAPASVLAVTSSGQNVIFVAPDGAVAECHPPFPPVPGLPVDAAPGAYAQAITAHALAPRTVGVLLVRLGGYAAGVFTGSPPVLMASKTGSRLVHGRSAAGGWSQHRFARRREKQASEALQAAADAAAAVFGRWADSGATAHPSARSTDNSKRRRADAPERSGYKGGPAAGPAGGEGGTGLDAVVLGGDKRAVAELRTDPRLLSYLALATDRFLTVPDPKLAVLADTPRMFLAVRIKLVDR
jgi:Actinobacteria/chloroflexi VLRF1 release factor